MSHRREDRLFGGFTDSSPFFLGDTWEWDGEEWVQVADTGRSPRVPMLTYDPARNVAVLFGGAEAGGDLFDTWEKASDKTWRADGPVLVSCVQAAPSQAHVPLPPKELAEPLSRTVTCRAASYTMLWDGDAWTQIEDEGPQAPWFTSIDSVRERVKFDRLRIACSAA